MNKTVACKYVSMIHLCIVPNCRFHYDRFHCLRDISQHTHTHIKSTKSTKQQIERFIKIDKCPGHAYAVKLVFFAVIFQHFKKKTTSTKHERLRLVIKTEN